MPKRKVSSAEGPAQEAPKRRWAGLSATPAPAKVDAKPKKAAGKDNSAAKNVQRERKRGAKGKQAPVADQEPTEDLPAGNGETEGGGVQPPMKQERKKPSLVNGTGQGSAVVPVSLFAQSRGIVLATVLQMQGFE
ncbi:Non-histone chromosomal protein HMG-14 [Myotis brandtii]|uniref:Non-histone chromosomal protein HMG-14 n=1 Tax=Myotis brandtii TaxID=109478 RepID=S7Q9M0_MYOBR|nr:Non-histone chromosomal protein HMG-14 [Myotis brandtii]